jgi:hypothetical protein
LGGFLAHSNAEAEYRAMTHIAFKILWVCYLLRDMGVDVPSPTHMNCDNHASIFLASNPEFHERTKYIVVDCHFICDILMQK